MCGICGIVYADGSAVDPAVIRAMCGAIAHRGPDDEGVFLDGGIGLGARRLSIIDLAGGHQPISSEDGSVTVVYNGEIYNYRQLKGELAAKGHRFATNTDTEVLVHAYEERGLEMLSGLRGMFALALWDGRRERLLVATDRFGIKPVYWSFANERLVLGSEMSCLLTSGIVPREVDIAALAEYLAVGYVPAPATILAGVSKLSPGTWLSWQRGSDPELGRYWAPPRASASSSVSVPELQSQLLETIRDAVRAHLISDVPLGAFLSGGIDSRIVVAALMAQEAAGTVKTFSIGFDDPEHDEIPKARLVASRYGTDHHEQVVRPDAVEDVLPTLVAHFGEPFADSSALPTYYVSSLAAGSVKVALSGDGGDELFVGYTTFRGVDLAARLEVVPARARALAGRVAVRPPRVRQPALNDRLGRWSKRAGDSLVGARSAYRSKSAMSSTGMMTELLSETARDAVRCQNPFRRIDESLTAWEGEGDRLEPYLRTHLDVSLASDMLVKVDRMSMAHSLEVRVPLLDHVLAEMALSLPVRTRFPRWRLKGLLRDAARSLLPDEIVSQRKHGFTVPVSRWFRGDLTSYSREVLLDERTKTRGMLDLSRVEKALAEHASGARNHGAAIWSLVVLELWCRFGLDP